MQTPRGVKNLMSKYRFFIITSFPSRCDRNLGPPVLDLLHLHILLLPVPNPTFPLFERCLLHPADGGRVTHAPAWSSGRTTRAAGLRIMRWRNSSSFARKKRRKSAKYWSRCSLRRAPTRVHASPISFAACSDYTTRVFSDSRQHPGRYRGKTFMSAQSAGEKYTGAAAHTSIRW